MRNRATTPLVWISASFARSLPLDVSWPGGSARIRLRHDLPGALEELRREEPLLLLLDLRNLSPADLRLLPSVRGWYPSLPIIVAFSPQARDLAAQAVGLGATGYLPEPLGAAELVLWLRSALARPPGEGGAAMPGPGDGSAPSPPRLPAAGPLQTLVRGLSHEIRNPLATILGSAELRGESGEGKKTGEESREIRDTIQAATRIRDVLRDLQVAVEGVVPGEDRVDINAILRELRRDRIAAKASRSSELLLQLVEDLPPVLGDRGLLREAFGQILDNALQAIHEPAVSPSRVRLVTRSDSQDAITVETHDGGPGIPPGDRARVLLPFFSTREMGTGLGLSLAAGILRSHGATLRLDASPDGGTCVAVTLPSAS